MQEPHAHFVAFIVSIAALFDGRRDTVSLPGLAKEMGKANLLPAQTKSEVTALMAQAKPLVCKITILRHNAFAHRSATLSYDEALKAAVTALQMQELTEIALKIANRLTQARGRGEHFFNELAREDAEAMMKALAT
jgi:HEPN superfamily AbiU2-like protein